ncbi:Signal transduction histidine kinase [Oribacterium sp. KHPX15]|nr:Signal transduction histidine kinase [Oribacterium sp. KHPX15]
MLMMYPVKNKLKILVTVLCMVVFGFCGLKASAAEAGSSVPEGAPVKIGGGYAASGQVAGMSYTTEVYDATNGLPTSDAMCILSASDGHIWLGGYSGVLRYDGQRFERLDSTGGLTSGRDIFEDSKGRIWVGTNDNGVVVVDGENSTHYTYKEGLPSSSARTFTEDSNGNVYIGTVGGLVYIDLDGRVRRLSDERIESHRILQLSRTTGGKVYGLTFGGIIFTIKDGSLSEVHTGEEFNIDDISSILPDPKNDGKIYILTENSEVYYGDFGASDGKMERISIAPISNAHWISYNCGRIWVMSSDTVGYLDDSHKLQVLSNIKFHSGLEKMTADYQGNLWFVSSKQGVMKLVSNNFIDLTEDTGVNEGAVNAVCLVNNNIHIGYDGGYKVIDKTGKLLNDELTGFLGKNRIRNILKDSKSNVWVSVYTNGMGLVKREPSGLITAYTKKDGLPSEEIRCTTEAGNGDILVGTNEGMAVISDGKVTKTFGAKEGLTNGVILTLAQCADGKVYLGTDGGGIFVIENDKVTNITREDGLTSDVILRIKEDSERNVIWVITSNSVQYIKDGVLKHVSSFPYSNNYDIYFDEGDKLYVLSSLGLYIVDDREMLSDSINEYDLYTVKNGMPYAITGNSFSAMNSNGELFIAGRQGVIRTGIKELNQSSSYVKIGLESIDCDGTKVYPDDNGLYTIPSDVSRVRILPDIFEYSMADPLIHVYLHGVSDEGVYENRSQLNALEYTDLPYGNYDLHVEVFEKDGRTVISDVVYRLYKKPKLTDLLIIKLLRILIIAVFVGLLVWHFMNNTIIRKQYHEILLAKDEADRANSAKTRFLANITQELRTPIDTIMGMDEMILREDTEGVPRNYSMSIMNYAMDIRNASESLLSIINDFLDISRVESGKMSLIEQSYEVKDLLKSVVSMIRVRSSEKELSFDVKVDEMIPKQLYGDSGKIKEIVLNLLTNAVKFTDKGGFRLKVYMPERKDDVCSLVFSVKDTGIGIKAEDQDRLFTAYERLVKDSKNNMQGMGLGLDISKRFAELMGGNLICKSTYGKGSEFIFTVQQKIMDASPMGAFLENEEDIIKGQYVPQFIAPDADVLVVDDTPTNLSVIKGLLKPTKIFVTTASSGEECLEKLKETRFNIVLLDHMMPGMDGMETLEKIREKYPELPVYVLTANTSLSEEYYISRGFNGRLTKPIDSLILEKTVLKHLPEEMVEKPDTGKVIDELKNPKDKQKLMNTDQKE